MIRHLRSILGLAIVGAVAVGCTTAAGPSGPAGKPSDAPTLAPSAVQAVSKLGLEPEAGDHRRVLAVLTWLRSS
jgi:hypothetical protein